MGTASEINFATKKDSVSQLTHWSYVFLALTYRFVYVHVWGKAIQGKFRNSYLPVAWFKTAVSPVC